MEQIVTYLSFALDIIAVLFVLVCVKIGYEEGLFGVLKSTGTFCSMILAVCLAELAWPFGGLFIAWFTSMGSLLELKEEVLVLIGTVIAFIILYVIAFVIIKGLWDIIGRWAKKLCNRVVGTPWDKIFGVIVTGVLGVLFISFLIWLLCDVSNLISEEQLMETRLLSLLDQYL